MNNETFNKYLNEIPIFDSIGDNIEASENPLQLSRIRILDKFFSLLFSIEHKTSDEIKQLKILDIGCGNCYILNLLYKKDFKNLIGISNNKNDIEWLQDRGYLNRFNVFQGDIHDLDISDESIDIIIANNILEHTISPFIAMKEVNRILKPNGYVIVISHEEGDYLSFAPNTLICPTISQIGNLSLKTGFAIKDLYKFSFVLASTKLEKNIVVALKKEDMSSYASNNETNFVHYDFIYYPFDDNVQQIIPVLYYKNKINIHSTK